MIFHMDIAKIQYGGQRPGMVRVIFFPTGDNSKILSPSIEYSYPDNSEKYILSLQGVPMGPWGPFGSFQNKKRAILEQISLKIEVQYPFKTCFSPAGLSNKVDFQRKKLLRKIHKQGVKSFKKGNFLPKKGVFQYPSDHTMMTTDSCVSRIFVYEYSC